MKGRHHEHLELASVGRTEPGGGPAAIWSIRLARLHPAEPHRRRRAGPPRGRGRPRRRHVQPRHLREGHRRQQRLCGRHRGDLTGRAPRAEGGVRAPRGQGHPGRGGRAALRLRPHEPPRRLREPGGFARAGERHRGHAAGGAPAVEGGRPAQRHDQGAGDAGGRPCHPDPDRRGRERQRHAAVRARRVRSGGAGVHRGSGGENRPGRGPRPRGQRRELLREPHRHDGGRAPRGEAQGRAGSRQSSSRRPHGQGGDRQRQARLPELQEDLLRPALAGARRQGGADAARALGQHRHQEPALPRRDVRRGADRPRHREHGPAGDAGRLPGSRAGAARAGDRHRGRAADAGGAGEERRFAGQGDGRPARGRPEEVRRAVRAAAQGRPAPVP